MKGLQSQRDVNPLSMGFQATLVVDLARIVSFILKYDKLFVSTSTEGFKSNVMKSNRREQYVDENRNIYFACESFILPYHRPGTRLSTSNLIRQLYWAC